VSDISHKGKVPYIWTAECFFLCGYLMTPSVPHIHVSVIVSNEWKMVKWLFPNLRNCPGICQEGSMKESSMENC